MKYVLEIRFYVKGDLTLNITKDHRASKEEIFEMIQTCLSNSSIDIILIQVKPYSI
jgi:phosphoribosylformylglycinamidine (FGAM) synthase PurS component